MAPRRLAHAFLAALGAALVAAPTASATSTAGGGSSAAGVTILFRYGGSLSSPGIDPPPGPIYAVDTRTRAPLSIAPTFISIEGLTLISMSGLTLNSLRDLAVLESVDVGSMVVPVPEPSSAMLLSFGVALVAAHRSARRRRRILRLS